MVFSKTKIKRFFLLVGVVFVFFLFTLSSFASSPAFSFLNVERTNGSKLFFDGVDAGEKRTGTLSLSLIHDVPAIFTIQFIDNMGRNISSANIDERGAEFFSFENWIKLNVESPIFLNGLETLEIPYEINVPEGALPGDYTGLFIAAVTHYGDKAIEIKESLVDGTAESFTGTKINIGLALDFMLRVSGELNPVLEFDSLDFFVEQVTDRFNLNVSYSNKGNVGVIPKGVLTISNAFGREVYSGDFRFPVIGPNQSKTSLIKLSTKDFYLGYGIYNVEVDLYYDVFSREIGENLVYVAGKANMRIYSFPWYMFLIFGVLLFGILFLVLKNSVKRFIYLKKSKEYTIKAKDNLQTVSEKYGVKPDLLIFVNKLKAPYFLTAGEKLLIPLKNKQNEISKKKK